MCPLLVEDFYPRLESIWHNNTEILIDWLIDWLIVDVISKTRKKVFFRTFSISRFLDFTRLRLSIEVIEFAHFEYNYFWNYDVITRCGNGERLFFMHSVQELRTGYSIVTYTYGFKHYSSPAVEWYRGFEEQIKMASVATETVLLLTSKLLVFQNTENKVLITSLTFSSDNSKRLARSDIHHEGDVGEGKNLQSLWVGVHVCIKRENICSWLVIHYQRLVCVHFLNVIN